MAEQPIQSSTVTDRRVARAANALARQEARKAAADHDRAVTENIHGSAPKKARSLKNLLSVEGSETTLAKPIAQLGDARRRATRALRDTGPKVADLVSTEGAGRAGAKTAKGAAFLGASAVYKPTSFISNQVLKRTALNAIGRFMRSHRILAGIVAITLATSGVLAAAVTALPTIALVAVGVAAGAKVSVVAARTVARRSGHGETWDRLAENVKHPFAQGREAAKLSNAERAAAREHAKSLHESRQTPTPAQATQPTQPAPPAPAIVGRHAEENVPNSVPAQHRVTEYTLGEIAHATNTSNLDGDQLIANAQNGLNQIEAKISLTTDKSTEAMNTLLGGDIRDHVGKLDPNDLSNQQKDVLHAITKLAEGLHRTGGAGFKGLNAGDAASAAVVRGELATADQHLFDSRDLETFGMNENGARRLFEASQSVGRFDRDAAASLGEAKATYEAQQSVSLGQTRSMEVA